jgi:hypothetical protein
LARSRSQRSFQAHGGVWFQVGDQQLHVGIEEEFAPALKAHPALRVTPDSLVELADRLISGGARVMWDEALPRAQRFYTDDPWGNRIELLASP